MNTTSPLHKDALEAFRTFNSLKTTFFIILLLLLLALQASFWLVDAGLLDPVIDSDHQVKFCRFPVLAQARNNTNSQLNEPCLPAASSDPQRSLDSAPALASPKHLRTAQWLDAIIRFLTDLGNRLILLAAVLYLACILLALNVAIVSRLPGLADTAKAVFLALFLLLFLAPWHTAFGWPLPCVLFSYEQLISDYRNFQKLLDPSFMDHFWYYGRYVAWWALVFILLLLAQWRSTRSARKIYHHINAPASAAPPNPPAPSAPPAG